MATIVSDTLSKISLNERLNFGNTSGIISVVTLIDLFVIVPSIIIFLAFNFHAIIQYGTPFLLFMLSFLFYLPLMIMAGGIFLSKKSNFSNLKNANEQTVPIILFFLLLFSLFGIYIPSVDKLAQMIPAFQSLNIAGGTIVLINLLLLLKNGMKIFKE